MLQQASIAVFLTVLAAFVAVYLARLARRQKLQSALRRRLGAADLRGAAGDSLLRASEAETESALAKLVKESGFGWPVATFVLRSLAAGAAGALVGAIAGGAGLALLVGLVGLIAIPFAARRAATQRLEQCDAQMPQALEIMSLALRAGHPLPSALAVAASEAPSPIADELRRAVDEHELGRPITEVLVAFGRRLNGSESVHTFVVAVLVLQQTGGNLIAVLERIVENARARSAYLQKLRALTSEGRTSAKMLAFLPGAFGILAAMADPTYAQTLLHEPAGQKVLALALALWALGILWTHKLVKTEA